MLQNDWMARGKKHGLITLAGMVHFAIYTISVMGALWLSGDGAWPKVYFFASTLIVFVSHWLIDATDIVERWIRFYHQTDVTMMRVMVDQTFHVVVLFLLVTILFN